jgi:uncharacterized protein YwqG
LNLGDIQGKVISADLPAAAFVGAWRALPWTVHWQFFLLIPGAAALYTGASGRALRHGRRINREGTGRVTVDDLRNLLIEGGLGRIADGVIARSAESIRLLPTPVDEPQLPLGTSKIGGRADLAPGFVWPRWLGLPQSFIAQLALTDLASYAASSALPPTGLLSFFYDAEQRTDGFDPYDRGSWLVTYTDVDSPALQRTPRPGGDSFAACALQFTSEITLPTPDAVNAEFQLTPEDRMAYGEIESRAYVPVGGQDVIHRLLGHPQPIQGDMQDCCRIAAQGVTMGKAADRAPGGEPLKAGAADWRLLLQIDSDDATGMMWGDVGRIYYWLTSDALARREFSAVWLIVQCC